ncbi:MAG: nuclear transport factor 2 family protein [Hyphomicrobium sp.]
MIANHQNNQKFIASRESFGAIFLGVSSRSIDCGTPPIEVVNGFNTAWARSDIEEEISYIAEDCVYDLHISDEALAFGGVTAGREKIAAVLRQIRKDFEYILYRPFKLNADGDTVRHQVEFMYRHLKSGEVLEGRFRIVMQVRDGRIVRADEYHDRAKVEAFLRLVAKREQEGEG